MPFPFFSSPCYLHIFLRLCISHLWNFSFGLTPIIPLPPPLGWASIRTEYYFFPYKLYWGIMTTTSLMLIQEECVSSLFLILPLFVPWSTLQSEEISTHTVNLMTSVFLHNCNSLQWLPTVFSIKSKLTSLACNRHYVKGCRIEWFLKFLNRIGQ